MAHGFKGITPASVTTDTSFDSDIGPDCPFLITALKEGKRA